jgi:hypothetical protein
MNLRKVLATGWLVVSILPIVYFPLSFVLMSSGMPGGSPDAAGHSFDFHFRATTYVIYLGWILVISYIAYMYKTPYVPKTKRGLWLAVLLFANVFALPFFWFHYVWQPLQNPELVAADDDSAPRSKVPFVIGLLIFLIFPFTFFLMSFQDGQSYEYLSLEFPISEGSSQTLDAGEVSITQPLRTHGAIRLEKVLTVSLTERTVKFEPTTISSVLYSAFEVPTSAVHSCSRQCGIGKEYILILEGAETQLTIDDVPELMDWCWNNQIPMLSSNARRDWLYNGASLPTADQLAAAMVSREAYNDKAKRACQGY